MEYMISPGTVGDMAGTQTRNSPLRPKHRRGLGRTGGWIIRVPGCGELEAMGSLKVGAFWAFCPSRPL